MTRVIRRATPADAATIVDYNRLLARESEGKELDVGLLQAGVAAGLADPDKALYFVAEQDGKIAGQMMITREWSDWRNGWFWWIQSVYVRPEYRRQGVFRSLFQHVRDVADKDSEVIGLRLYVERDNHLAHQTYQSLGMSWTSYLVLEKYPLD